MQPLSPRWGQRPPHCTTARHGESDGVRGAGGLRYPNDDAPVRRAAGRRAPAVPGRCTHTRRSGERDGGDGLRGSRKVDPNEGDHDATPRKLLVPPDRTAHKRGRPKDRCSRPRSRQCSAATAVNVGSRRASACVPCLDVDTDRQQRLGALRTPSAALARNQSIALAYADLCRAGPKPSWPPSTGITQQRIGQIVAIYCPHVGRLREQAAKKERERQRAGQRRKRAAARARARRDGTINRYRCGCKCDRCRAANARMQREWRQRTAPLTARDLRSQVERNRLQPSADQAPRPSNHRG